MAPQLFTRVTASVSAFLYQVGIRIFRYLDDWLILASSLEGIIRAMDYTLQPCSDCGVSREITFDFDSGGLVSGNANQILDFEGFSNSEKDGKS